MVAREKKGVQSGFWQQYNRGPDRGVPLKGRIQRGRTITQKKRGESGHLPA